MENLFLIGGASVSINEKEGDYLKYESVLSVISNMSLDIICSLHGVVIIVTLVCIDNKGEEEVVDV